jgi:hypothetical protein
MLSISEIRRLGGALEHQEMTGTMHEGRRGRSLLVVLRTGDLISFWTDERFRQIHHATSSVM